MTEWFRVSEQLPPQYVRVLACDRWSKHPILVCLTRNNEWHEICDNLVINGDATAETFVGKVERTSVYDIVLTRWCYPPELPKDLNDETIE